MFSIVVGRRDNDEERQLGDDEISPRDSSVDRTWKSRLLMITIASDEIFGSLSSSELIKVSSVFDSRGTPFWACNGSIATSYESGEALETGLWGGISLLLVCIYPRWQGCQRFSGVICQFCQYVERSDGIFCHGSIDSQDDASCSG